MVILKINKGFRAKAGTPIYKFDLNGEMVHTYTSIHDAMMHEHKSYQSLMAAVDSGEEMNGHHFSTGKQYNKGDRKPTHDGKKEPWETDGFFNIDGWRKVCF
ncbi:hypothetical protein SAMN05428988_0140 [Chitinophaga sp. YR573]|uniref:hypothetical protein n=1 Tax=Chitinophaga sp. YR573 TaxID=1881040 RepID=UPI0008CC2371|nr:hypothetical protein [Chitinophaga sp. YR573]SEV88752.1 hypothetical protein SAMN05428988_0140 [Chitinophaga sp. YR573]